MNKFVSILLIVLVSGCSAALVPMSSDPQTKLKQALTLYQDQNRPIPADRLYLETMEIYKNKDDDLGLADAYRGYAFFLQSDSVGKWSGYFRDKGFYDKSITYDKRYEIAREYFLKARATYEKNSKYDLLANIDLNLGHHYNLLMKDNKMACIYYDKSIQDYRLFSRGSPTTSIVLPKRFKTYDDYMAEVKRQTGCK